MNVNKYFSFAIVVFLMAVPLVLTSCGKDNILDDVEELQPELKVWTEPYHIEGSSIDDVKNYMDFSMKRYGLASETTISSSIQLTYTTGKGNEGILYSFYASNGALYSVIDTELIVNSRLVIEYLKVHYSLITPANEATLEYCFTNSDRSMVITTARVSDTCFNVSYAYVN
jgi:hypothetical protein